MASAGLLSLCRLVLPVLALHVFTIGGIVVLTLRMMARESLGHIDRALQISNTTATILSGMDTEIQTPQQHLSKTRQIKRGKLQELLIGKTRLIKPEPILSANDRTERAYGQ